MMVLALDLSTKNSGWAVYKNQELIAHGCISATNSNLYERIHIMCENVEKIVKKYNISKSIIEDVFPEDVHNNRNVFNALMYLQGFITDVLNTYKIEFKFYTASEWRKKCGIHTGRGIKRESLKAQDIKFVQNQFGIKVNDDEADAICIGFAAVGGTIATPQIITDEDGFEFA